jgi:hypothetical protein
LNELKTNYDLNCNEIFNLENELNELVQKNLQAKIKTMKIFSCLNAEKPTPMFLNLATTTKANHKLENIKKADGTPFPNKTERDEYIVDYYRKLYEKPAGERIDFNGCIEEFLGPDIAQNRIVLTQN